MPQDPQFMEWTPRGGMNQDDSIITPSPGLADSLFPNGDYRYALNGRIGSSRYNAFGDFETIRDTLEVTNYYARGSLFTNSDFEGSLTGWSQIDLGISGAWTYSNGRAAINFGVDDILYQAISASEGDVVTLEFAFQYLAIAAGSAIEVRAVFLNGTSVISTQEIVPIPTPTPGVIGYKSGSIQLTIPATCDGIGIQQISTPASILSTFYVDYARVYGWTSSSQPAGTNKVIGRLEDNQYLRLYYAVYNSNDDHTIRYWDLTSNSIYELMKWDGLKFESNYFVKFARINNWLGFTDRNNAPRLMDVNTISDLFTSLGSDFREFHISFHKWGPTMPPIVERLPDNDYRFKSKGVFQFSYRYIYNGNLLSRWSPISVAHVAKELESPFFQYAIQVRLPGFFINEPDATAQWNYFGHDDDKFLKAVQYVEIAFKDGIEEIWKVWKRVKTSDLPSDLTFDFYNDEIKSIVSTSDFFEAIDTVPFKAGTIEAIDNRFMFGDCLNELEEADPVSVSNVTTVTSVDNDVWNTDGGYSSLTAAQSSEYVARNAGKNFNFKARSRVKLAIQYFHKTGWRSLGYTSDDWIYRIPMAPPSSYVWGSSNYSEPPTALTFKLNHNPPEWAVAYQILRSNNLDIEYFIEATCNKIDYLIDNAATIPFYSAAPDSVKDTIDTHFNNEDLITATEAKTIVEDATVQRLEEVGASFTDSLARKVRAKIRSTQQITTLASASRLYIDINNWYNASKSNSSGSTNYPMNSIFYDFRDGDRVRFVGSNVSNPSASQKKIYDEPILEFTGNAIIVAKPIDLVWIPIRTSGNDQDFAIEVYREKDLKDTDFDYHEVGEWYPVLYPGSTQRTWSKSDFTWSTKATVTGIDYGTGSSLIRVFNKVPFYFADCHILNKAVYADYPAPSATGTLWTSMNPFELYETWEKNNGRTYPSYIIFPSTDFIETQIRFGGRYLDESLVNLINKFSGRDEFIYPNGYGRIRDLVATQNTQVESVGEILLAIGEREAWSIYVNRTTLEDLSGRTQVSISSKVLGSFNKLLGSHGTFNPESVCINRGRVYWWDALNGTWVRYGRDGLTPLSERYKMRNWFKEISALLIGKYLTDEIPIAISGFDAFNEELITFQNHSSLPSTLRGYSNYKGAFFSENDTRWKSIHNYAPEMFGSLNDKTVSFVGGKLYVHEAGTDHLTIYGDKKDAMVEPVFNSFPKDNKIWESICIISTDGWSAQQILGEFRGLKTQQASILELTNFTQKEDYYWADILRDQNTSVSNPVIEGDRMRGKAIQVLLKLDPSIVSRTALHYVLIGWVQSPKNA